eukprot:scaffold3254_cov98-Cylindrotheca_fusiformis.AAC.6
MDPIFEAASLNNEGAYQLLFEKDYIKAISSFRTAMMKAKAILRTPAKGARRPLEDNLPPAAEAVLDFVDSEDSNDASWGKKFPRPPVNLWDLAFICRSTIVISKDSTSEEVSVNFLPKIIFSAVYNLALAHHLHGMSVRSTRHLRMALKFYEISYRLQMADRVCSNPKHVLSVFNNRAMIYRCMGDELKASEFLRRLCSVMSSLDEKGQRTDEHNWRGFLSNAVELLLEVPVAAATA